VGLRGAHEALFVVLQLSPEAWVGPNACPTAQYKVVSTSQAHLLVLHEIGDCDRGSTANTADTMDDCASAPVGMFVDLVGDPVKVDVYNGIGHVVEE